MFEREIIIEKIYWEKLQLIITGYSVNHNLEENKFLLKNLDGSKLISANYMYISKEKFMCRFNMPIVYDPNKFLSEKYILVDGQGNEYKIKSHNTIEENNFFVNKKRCINIEILERKNSYILNLRCKKI